MIRIGVICPSEIAFRRFMPALKKVDNDVEFAGIAYASPEEWFSDLSVVSTDSIKEQQDRERTKAQLFVDTYGGKVYSGYQQLIETKDIDAIYIPLPPALHFRWAKLALENQKHVFLEKPSTTSLADTDILIKLASQNGLALHENYMFIFHSQISALDDLIKGGEIGSVRLYRISFGFPLRSTNDFRYNKDLGGGALLDAGGYTMKYALHLLGETARLVTAQSNYINGFSVEMFGSCTMVNDCGLTAQLAFGMDNDYKCEVEIWGSKGTILSNRIFTSPDGFIPSYTIKKNQDIETHGLPSDDAFLKSIMCFITAIKDRTFRENNYRLIHKQQAMVDRFMNLCNMSK